MQQRLKQMQRHLREQGLDLMLVSNPANRYYLSGFDGSSGYLLVGPEQAIIITDFRYIEQARRQAPAFRHHPWQEDLSTSLLPLLNELKPARLGFESRHLVYSTYRELAETLSLDMVPLENTVEKIRMIKSASEIEVLRRGAAELDRAFNYILGYIRPGQTEREVAFELEYYLRRNGAAAASFSYIVASGERGSMPHAVASNKVLEPGELVTIDFGAVFDGYATDMTRTVALGRVGERQKAIYDLVCRAQQRALEGMAAGISCREADRLARAVIEQAGYGDCFGHGLGHGVGLETHEMPVLSPRGQEALAAGMIVTVEPGVYIAGWGGVRIEDMVLVKENGVEILTCSSKELLIV